MRGRKNLIDYFVVLGVHEKLSYFHSTDEKEMPLTKIEIVSFAECQEDPVIKSKRNEKWIDWDGTNTLFLKCTFGVNEPPITEVNFFRIKQKAKTKELVKGRKCEIEPVPILKYGEPPNFEKQVKTIGKEKKHQIVVYKGEYDLTEYVSSEKQPNTSLCLCYSYSKSYFPITDVVIKVSEKNEAEETILKLPPNYSHLPFRLGKEAKNRYICFRIRNPMTKQYKPEILDRYPLNDRENSPLTTSLSTFCFPEGIKFAKIPSTPKYFSFILTNQFGDRLYGNCLTFYESPSVHIQAFLKRQNCSDLKNVFVPKIICIISQFGFNDPFKKLLKQMYRIHISQSYLPIERYICNFMEEIPIPDKGKVKVEYDIGNITIEFFRPLSQYPPYSTKEDIDFLFRSLNIEYIVDIFATILLEKKVLFISKHKALLGSVISAFLTLLYPFSWNHVLVPILPDSMKAFLEAPVPYMIGIDSSAEDALSDLPLEANKVYLDENKFLCEQLPNLPKKDYIFLITKLKALCGRIFQRPDPFLEQVDEAFTTIYIDPEEFETINEIAVRDIFLEFMTRLIRNYQKYLLPPRNTKLVCNDFRDVFNRKAFLSNRDSSKPVTFLFKFTETNLFANFIETQSFGGENYPEILYFVGTLKQKRTKKSPYILQPFIPSRINKALAPNDTGLSKTHIFQYETFPRLNSDLFIQPRIIHNFDNEERQRTFMKKEEMNLKISKMNSQEWSKHLIECIYGVWFTLFSAALPNYPGVTFDMIRYAKVVLNTIRKRYKPVKNVEFIYRRLIEACGKANCPDEAMKFFQDLKNEGVVPDIETISFCFQACGSSSIGDMVRNYESPSSNKKTPDKVREEQKSPDNVSDFTFSSGITSYHKELKIRNKIKNLVESALIEFPEMCNNEECQKLLREEEVLSGFTKNLNCYTCTCIECRKDFIPEITITTKADKKTKYYLLSPVLFFKEVTNLITNKGDKIFFQVEFYKQHKLLFWNTLLYFRLISLPHFFLDLHYSKEGNEEIRKILKKPLPVPIESKGEKNKFTLPSSTEPKSKRCSSNKGLIMQNLQILENASVQSKESGGSAKRGVAKSEGAGSRKDTGSNVTNNSDLDKVEKLATSANSKVVKLFGPLLEDYRRKKVELKFELFGPQLHVPFNENVKKNIKDFPEAVAPKKSVEINSQSKFKELVTNDWANSIIDESTTSNRSGSIGSKSQPVMFTKKSFLDAVSSKERETIKENKYLGFQSLRMNSKPSPRIHLTRNKQNN